MIYRFICFEISEINNNMYFDSTLIINADSIFTKIEKFITV